MFAARDGLTERCSREWVLDQERSTDRLQVLDGLRATSILLVLACHMLPLGPKILQLNYSAGAMGMSLFFSLSGFLIVSTLLHNPNVPEFLVKRAVRILPLAYAYLIFVYTIVWFDPSAAFWTSTFFVNYLPNYFVGGLNAHFWSLCVEVQFYLAVAVIVLMGGRVGLWSLVPICLLITLIRVHEGAYIAIQTHLRVDEILIGGCVALFYHRSGRWSVRFPTVLAFLAAALWFLSSTVWMQWFQYFRPYATGLMLAIVLCHKDTALAFVLRSRAMRYIATISYALYIIHPLTLHGWLGQGPKLDMYLFKRPISFLITFVAAHLSTFYWEKMWMRAGRNWIRGRKAQLANPAV
jgi:peptidoglycan/LPS O-acetylase OafA/YrhL